MESSVTTVTGADESARAWRRGYGAMSSARPLGASPLRR
jgi:hypothetical protein